MKSLESWLLRIFGRGLHSESYWHAEKHKFQVRNVQKESRLAPRGPAARPLDSSLHYGTTHTICYEYYLLLLVSTTTTIYCLLLLVSTVYYCLLLPSTIYYCLLLLSTIYYCLLLVSATTKWLLENLLPGRWISLYTMVLRILSECTLYYWL